MAYKTNKEMEEQIRARLFDILYAEQDLPYLTTFAGNAPEKVMKGSRSIYDKSEKAGGYVDGGAIDEIKLKDGAREVLASIIKTMIMNPLTDQDVDNLRAIIEDRQLVARGGSLIAILDAVRKYGPSLTGMVGSLVKTGLTAADYYGRKKKEPLVVKKAELDIQKAEKDIQKAERDIDMLKKREQDVILREQREKGLPPDVKALFDKIAKK